MRPSHVVIKQFRSIRELRLEFDPTCLILLGINETGKTNILRALALLSPDARISPDDARQVPSHEPDPTESSVEYCFPIDTTAQSNMVTMLDDRTYGSLSGWLARDGAEDLDAKALFVRHAKELFYFVNILNRSRSPRCSPINAKLEANEKWLTTSKQCPANHQFADPTTGQQVRLRDFWIFDKDALPPGQPEQFFRPLTGEDIADFLGRTMTKYADDHVPECIYWSYANDNVLPSSVELEQFLKEPAAWPALKNMFRLGGFSDPADAIKKARSRSNGVRTLLERAGLRTTEYIRSVWGDFSPLTLELHENGSKLECFIRDVHGAYDFSRRSDGFRRFVGFLLQISSRMAVGSLEGAILLYDEPDTSLHPTGAKQLRDELLKLAERNIVVYSTHSIFMVDPDNLSRHIVVKRQSEVTTVQIARPGIVRDEEVLYNAIGYSIFDVLAENNLILEGHRDIQLLDCAIAANESLQAEFHRVGKCHAGGVKNIGRITPLLELAGRGCLVVSDGDRPAMEAQKDYAGHAKWVTYTELLGPPFATAEDFFKQEYVYQVLRDLEADSAKELSHVVASGLEHDKPVMQQLVNALAQQNLPKERRSEILDLAKTALFHGLSSEVVRPELQTLLQKIAILLTQVCPQPPAPLDTPTASPRSREGHQQPPASNARHHPLQR